MAKYLDTDSINDLISQRERIFAVHREVYDKYGIDILANDTLSSLSIWEIVSKYDSDYNTNFHRNGEDAISGEVKIENKCATVTPSKTKNTVGKAGFQFHAQGSLAHDRYIFAVRRKDNLKIARLWDIASESAVAAVQECLFAGRQGWIDRGMPNHDAIVVPEKLLFDLPIVESMIIDGCTVYKV